MERASRRGSPHAGVTMLAAALAALLIASCPPLAVGATARTAMSGSLPTAVLPSGFPTPGAAGTTTLKPLIATPTPAVHATAASAPSPPPTESSQTSEPTFGPPVVRQGDFQLTLTSSATQYDVGQPISVSATFAYLGSKDAIKIASLGPGPLGWGVFQRDGLISSMPDWTLACVELDMTRVEPITQPFTKMSGLQGDGVSNTESRQWLTDPDLTLPAGRWVIYVEAMAGPDGIHCQDWLLQASTEIVVR